MHNPFGNKPFRTEGSQGFANKSKQGVFMKKKVLMSLVLLAIIGTSAVFAQKTTFNGHQYQLFEDSKTWTDAKAHCESLGGYLVTINSQAEQAFIESLVSKGKKNFYWIGGYCETNRVFRWVTGEPMTYTNWVRGEPNNAQGRQDKMAIYRLRNPKTNSNPYQWDDVANDGLISGEPFFSAGNFGYICEFESAGGRASVQTLDGVWEFDGFQITIKGSTGTYSRMNSSPARYLKDAIDKGFIKVGTQYFRNLKSTGALTWSGQELLFDYSGNITNKTVWIDCTITLSADGQTLQSKTDHTSLTLTKARQGASAVSALNGRWVRGDSEITFNNGNFQIPDGNSQFLKGTYTTSGNNVTIKVTEAYGGHPTFQGMVDSKWYTRSAMKTTKLGPHFTEAQLDDIYLTQTWTYSVSGNRLTLEGEVYTKR
jgi:hypothetical protein